MFDLNDTLAALTDSQRAVLLALLDADKDLSWTEICERCPSVSRAEYTDVLPALNQQDLAGPHHAWPTVTYSARPWLRSIYAQRMV